MLTGLIGNKIGMTQVFDADRRVVPVTAIAVQDWYVTQLKTQDRDGYNAVQIGKLKKRYATGQARVDKEWLQKKSAYFSCVRELSVTDADDIQNMTIGAKFSLDNLDIEGMTVQVTGTSIGKGFQGVVKRWNFAGGPASHGSTFHNIPGSIGSLRRQGFVMKGKKLPGHMGARTITVKGLRVVRVDKDNGYIFISGAVPGKKNSTIVVKKQG